MVLSCSREATINLNHEEMATSQLAIMGKIWSLTSEHMTFAVGRWLT